MLNFLPEAQSTESHEGALLQTDRYFMLSLDMLCAIGGDGYFRELNPRWEETLGFTNEELLAQPWYQLIHPDERWLTLEKFQKLASDSETISFKNRYLCADGSYKWLLWNATFCEIEQVVHAVVRDITESKRSRQALRDSEESFRCLVENVNDYAIYMLDPEGRVISWNQGAERINGYREEEIIGKPVARFYPSEDIQIGKPKLELHLAATTGRFEDESYRIRRDGSRFCAHAIITALRDKKGQLRGFAKVVRDITERKRVELALQKAHNQLEQRVLERTAELSETNQRLLQEINEREQVEAQLREQTEKLQQTLHELKRTQAQLVQSEKMSSLGQLVAGIAHEINNPVNFITGNLNYTTLYIQDLVDLLNLYQRHYPQPLEEIQAKAEEIDLDFVMADLPKLVHSMKVGADRIHKLVLSLRNFSHLDTAGYKPINLHQGIEDTLLLLQHRLKAKAGKPEIAVSKEYGQIPKVNCCGGQLNEVFMNILSNAIDALEEEVEERKNLSPQIAIYTELINEDWVAIHISDNGSGIKKNRQRQIFDPFFTTKPVGKGTGLGLSISYQIIVEKHGGRLKCLSSPGKGAKFIMEIPVRQTSQENYGNYSELALM
ncbi:MAG: PAS domain S-box protein [Coleofasciculaceae cyanobacterium]